MRLIDVETAAMDNATLSDWYISSVGEESPIWTDEHIEELLNDFYVVPKSSPAIEAEPVRYGEWVYGESDIPHCSECGAELKEISPYCPKCGAKMESDNDKTIPNQIQHTQKNPQSFWI